MMGFIDNHSIPRLGVQKCTTLGSALCNLLPQRMDRSDHHLRNAPKIGRRFGNLPAVHLQAEVKHLVEALLPLRHQLGRGKDQQAANLRTSDQRH